MSIDISRQLLLLGISTLFVTQTTGANAQNYEIMPFIGWRSSSSLEEETTGETVKLDKTRSFGILMSMQRDHDSSYDFLFSRQDTDIESKSSPDNNTSIKFDYYHVGGTVYYSQNGLYPFVSGGLGVTHISPANDIFSSETKFSLSIGGGIKFPLTENIGLRLEARGYGTIVDGSGSILCTGGDCLIKFKGDLFTQFEATAGLAIAF